MPGTLESLSRDFESFGNVLLFGIGGVFDRALADRSPLDVDETAELLDSKLKTFGTDDIERAVAFAHWLKSVLPFLIVRLQLELMKRAAERGTE